MTETQSRVVRHSLFRMTVHTEIEFTGDPESVWAVLTDFAGYQHWNTAIPSAKGEAVKGSQLRVLIQWPELKPDHYTLEVLAADSPQRLRRRFTGVNRFVFRQDFTQRVDSVVFANRPECDRARNSD